MAEHPSNQPPAAGHIDQSTTTPQQTLPDYMQQLNALSQLNAARLDWARAQLGNMLLQRPMGEMPQELLQGAPVAQPPLPLSLPSPPPPPPPSRPHPPMIVPDSLPKQMCPNCQTEFPFLAPYGEAPPPLMGNELDWCRSCGDYFEEDLVLDAPDE